jgi:hypothetical protein
LHVFRDSHLAEADGGRIHRGKEATPQETVILESADKDVFFLFLQFGFIKGQAQRLSQDLMPQMHHLQVFLRSMIYHPKRHAVIRPILTGRPKLFKFASLAH